ncbi:GPI transamidase component [Myotisia sp. PD_48]|nr:GPI transamidase component [Myotisia sp. PD_48]
MRGNDYLRSTPPGETSHPQNSTDTMGKVEGLVYKPAPLEKPKAIRRRSLVVFAFWSVILFLGLPMWWKTTSIYRAKLPLVAMGNWADGLACRPTFPLHIRVHTPDMPTSEAESMVQAIQHALDDLNDFWEHHLRLQLTKTKEDHENIEASASELGIPDDTALILRLLQLDNITAPTSELHPYSERLDIYYPRGQIQPQSSSHPITTFIAEELRSLFNEEKTTLEYILSRSNIARMPPTPPLSAVPATQKGAKNKEQRTNAVNPSTSSELIDAISRRIAKSFTYAETYHLSFSLFTPGAQPSSWDIESAIDEYLTPLLNAFAPISNFSIDTQVQVYATFSPTANAPEWNEQNAAFTLKKGDLSGFINAAEWPLSPSIGGGPTINFIVYVPSKSQSPLVIGQDTATSWIIPQWGGVVILNPADPDPDRTPSLSREALKPAMATFSHQLLTLLGTPTSPQSLPLRLQSLIRIHTISLLLSASSTMGSLARLTHSLASIPIPMTVATSVANSLSHLSTTCDLLHQGAFKSALANARIAEHEAERSFFEKSMVGQVYFPEEHKIAVYLPLLGPVGVPLVLGLIKEIRGFITRLRS